MPSEGQGPLHARVYRAQSPIHGLGCFARIGFAPGDLIGHFAGPFTRRNGRYVLWVDDHQGGWIGRSGRNLLRWVNHSDRPNACFDGFDLYAVDVIAPGDEITCDYGADPSSA
jgi:uncharacterized protein